MVQVADLFESVFRKRTTPAPASLREYFGRIYFQHPWRDERLHSFVYDLGNGEVAGFLGVLPLRLRLGSEPLLGAVAGNLMVRRDLKNPLVGARLVKTFLGGGQDLSISDTANEISRRMWEASGGVTLMLPSLSWIRVLRPTLFARYLLERRVPGLPLKRLSRFACSLVDACAEGFRARPQESDSADWTARESSDDELLTTLTRTSQGYALRPDYDRDAFKWLMQRVHEKTRYGPLHRRIVCDGQGSPVGWFLYYGRKGECAHILQLGTQPKGKKAVFSALIADARRSGCIALMGGVEPRLMRDLANEECIFVLRGAHVVAHSTRQDVLDALQNGDAFVSRLEGEWWTRLQGDVFEP